MAVFHFFDLLAYPDNDPQHPNRFRAEYGGDTTDSHPNSTGVKGATAIGGAAPHATNPTNFLDTAWATYANAPAEIWSYAKLVNQTTAVAGDTLTYTITIGNSHAATLSDTIPSGLAYLPGTLWANSGVVNDSQSPTLTWQGNVAPDSAVTISYAVTVSAITAQLITNQAQISVTGQGTTLRSATVLINGRSLFLPLLIRP